MADAARVLKSIKEAEAARVSAIDQENRVTDMLERAHRDAFDNMKSWSLAINDDNNSPGLSWASAKKHEIDRGPIRDTFKSLAVVASAAGRTVRVAGTSSEHITIGEIATLQFVSGRWVITFDTGASHEFSRETFYEALITWIEGADDE